MYIVLLNSDNQKLLILNGDIKFALHCTKNSIVSFTVAQNTTGFFKILVRIANAGAKLSWFAEDQPLKGKQNWTWGGWFLFSLSKEKKHTMAEGKKRNVKIRERNEKGNDHFFCLLHLFSESFVEQIIYASLQLSQSWRILQGIHKRSQTFRGHNFCLFVCFAQEEKSFQHLFKTIFVSFFSLYCSFL